VLAACLQALGVIAVILGLAGAVIVVAASPTEGWRSSAVVVMWMLVALAAGWMAGGVLWAAAWLCRGHHHQTLLGQRIVALLERLPAEGMEMLEVPLSSASSSSRVARAGPIPLEGEGRADSKPAPTTARARLEAALEQLRELNVNLLLTESQRQLKRQHLLERQAARLTRDLEQALASDQYPQAEEDLERLVRLAPDWPQLGDLRRRVDQARSAAEARDVEAATGRAQDLMATGQFLQAKTAAEELLAKHPALPAVTALVARVERERAAYVKEQRLTMYRKVETEAAHRHWRPALAAAEELLAAYPDSPEADTVRSRLDTLRDNAQIEEVRELRDRIRDLISRRRFPEALELAKDVVHRFPNVAAADELRQQMGRLEELAKSHPSEGA
jgi:tetratricopeptide (TPR) repeat protein